MFNILYQWYILLYYTILCLLFFHFLSHALYWKVIENENYFYIEHYVLIYLQHREVLLAHNISSEF